MAEFEDILEDIGTFGPFQIRVFILVSLFETPAAWSMFLPIFIQKLPDWTCGPISNTTTDNNNTANESEHDELNQYCDADGLYCDSGYNVTFMTNRTTVPMEFALCGKNLIADLITPLQMFGVLCGACIFGQLADTFGRRLVFFIVYSLLLVASFATAFAPTWEVYTVCRVFVGVFFGGTMVINFVLPMEFVGARWRTFCGCIGFWAVGHMLLAPLAYLLPNWRYLCIVCAALGLPLLAAWWWVPESPRWLIQQGRIAEANRILKSMAKCNGKNFPDAHKLQRLASFDACTKEEHKKYSYWDLFRNCNMTKNTLIIIYAWFVSSAVYYGTSFNVQFLTGNMYLNFFLLGLAEIPAVIFVVIVNNKFGRKKTLSFLMLLAGLSCFVIVLLYILDKKEDGITLAFAMLGKFGIAGAWAAAQVFSAELYPTVVRNIGIGASSMAARIGGITAPVIVDLAKQPHNFALSPLPFAVFGCLAFACGVLSFFLPETLNRPLPDALPPRRGCCRGMREEYAANDSEDSDNEEPIVTSHNGTAHVIEGGAGGGACGLGYVGDKLAENEVRNEQNKRTDSTAL